MKFPRLTPEEEYEHGSKALLGDEDSKQALISHNLRLVIMQARRYTKDDHDIMDLIAEGNRGLAIASGRYDPTIGKFSTFAMLWIKQKMLIYMQKKQHIRVPSRIYWEANALRKQAEGPSATARDVAKSMAAEAKIPKVLSLHSKQSEGFEELEFFVSAPDSADEVQLRERDEAIEQAMAVLTEREQHVIRERFFESKSLQEVGQEMGVSRERIRQIQAFALSRIRSSLCRQLDQATLSSHDFAFSNE